MPLCVVIGRGAVGDYVSKNIQKTVPDAVLVLLKSSSIRLLGRNRVHIMAFERFRNLFASHNITEIMFAGPAIESQRSLLWDSLARRYFRDEQSRSFPQPLWYPHFYLSIIRKFLEDSNVVIRNIVDLMPELGVQQGFRAGPPITFNAQECLAATVDYMTNGATARFVRNTCILDGRHVIFARNLNTDKVINRFFEDPIRDNVPDAVLCKDAIDPFRHIIAPTIGLTTLKLCAASGISSIILKGGNAILMQREEVIRFANEHSISIQAL